MMIKRFYKKFKKPILALAVLATAGFVAIDLLYIYKLYKMHEAPVVVEADRRSEIVIEGLIRDLSPQINQINSLVKRGYSEIFIKINSPGGGLKTTERMMQAINVAQYHGVEFTCVVDGMAASAATVILSQCDNRYAIFGSGILWHSMLT